MTSLARTVLRHQDRDTRRDVALRNEELLRINRELDESLKQANSRLVELEAAQQKSYEDLIAKIEALRAEMVRVAAESFSQSVDCALAFHGQLTARLDAEAAARTLPARLKRLWSFLNKAIDLRALVAALLTRR